ncbi:prepilin-type N-terminal cleavage/methylation domain-containing protein [Gammaproteobacteria bacterium AB-CW1]|uniref:Prepilin-type N-terminal cleavage/methylation domain-containing protein n=2 Tax=Natronospira TaxID=2024969 RepID=A0AAP6JH87_9GAMM|nr:prepilin-type N-terminal cleavage/methylation domain-containing protein [Gammaproteobacteria bacterium AB-CW1]
MTQGRREQGFTLIELTVVLVVVGLLSAVAVPRFIDLSSEAGQAAVDNQARALISNNQINLAACEAGSPECVDISVTGGEACEQAMASFLPEVDLDRYAVSNISSDTPVAEWRDEVGPGQALFWVDRFLGPSEPPGSWENADWNTTQPCLLERI